MENNANVQTYPEKQIDFSALAEKHITPSRSVIEGRNGSVDGLVALQQSLQRSYGDSYLIANDVLNEKCLPAPVTKSNKFKVTLRGQNSFERLSECLGVETGLEVCHD